jgi:hypothetical protein
MYVASECEDWLRGDMDWRDKLAGGVDALEDSLLKTGKEKGSLCPAWE